MEVGTKFSIGYRVNLMSTFVTRMKQISTALSGWERGALSIEHALFTSIGGTGCVALSSELASAAERGLEIVHQAMP